MFTHFPPVAPGAGGCRRAAVRLALPALLLAALGVSLPVAAGSLPSEARTEHASLALASEVATVAPGSRFRVAFTLTGIPGWHTYWKNPGDTGLPTRITWTLPDGVSAGPIDWPLPSRLPTPPLMSFGYQGPARLLVTLATPAGLSGILPLRAKVNWLVCAEQCVPESAEVGLDLPVGTAAPSAQAGDIAAAVAALPDATGTWQVSAHSDGRWLRVDGAVPEGQEAPARLWLFPDRKGLIAPAADQPYHHQGREFALAVPLAPPMPGVAPAGAATGTATPAAGGAPAQAVPDGPLDALLAADGPPGSARGWIIRAAIEPAARVDIPADNGSAAQAGASAPAAGLAGLLAALGLAFAGGLLLNLMPCVLPVLSIKVFALLGDAGRPHARTLHQGLVFLAGVLVSFWLLAALLLALKGAGSAIGWGFQLQSPPFVVALSCLFTVLALNFAGVFEIGTAVQVQAAEIEQITHRHVAHTLGSFSAGVLTTLVATPCTAPFLGAGIGFTLGRSNLEALLVFTAMGLGVGLPVTLLAAFPAWLRHLPRPGAWMLVLKQLFAFPMLATVAWLCWVLGHQRGVDALGLLLLGLVLVGLGCWLWGRAQDAAMRAPGGTAARLQGTLAVAVLLGGLWLAWPREALGGAQPPPAAAAEADGQWQSWTPERLAALRSEGRPVFVDFTAAWCISCQVNKRTSLRTSEVAERMRRLGVVALEADWTNADPRVTAALAGLQRNAVPVYAVYPRNGGSPHLLPEVLTQALVLDALDQAAR